MTNLIDKKVFPEIGHIGYKNVENFMLISKILICLGDKMLPQKFKIKKPFLKVQTWHKVIMYFIETNGRFLSGGIILGSPLSCTDLFLYTITLPAASCDAPPTLSYTTLELATKKPASRQYGGFHTLASFKVHI